MGILQSIRGGLASALPKQPGAGEVAAADDELASFHQEEEQLWQAKTIEESVERRVREGLEQIHKEAAQARNLNPFDSRMLIAPEAQGDSYPVSTGTALTYGTLRKMAEVPVIAGIFETRLAQLADFCRRQRHKNELGYRVVMRDHNRAPTTAALKRIAEIEAWYETCGDPSQQVDPSFETFVNKIMRDSLRYDQACAEILHDKHGRPAAMIPVDAKTIRLAAPTGKEIENLQRNLRKQYYVQVQQDGQVRATWDSDHFMFGIRKPRTDMEAFGYGYPELETLARIVTYLLQAEFYNAANFTNGVHAAGLVIVKSGMNQQQFQMLDKKLRQSLSGAHNAHRMAFMQLNPEAAEDVKMLPFNANNKDMEFSQWCSWLLKVACSLYQMDPSEVNFVYGNENQRSSFAQADPAEKVALSKERGLRPLLRALEGWLNRSITYRLDEDFRMEFVGLDSKSPLVQSQLDTQCLGWEAPNEVRARHDQAPKTHWVYNEAANPVTLNIIAQEKAAALAYQQAQEQQAKQAAVQAQQQATAEGQGAAPAGTGTVGGGAQDLPEELPPEFNGQALQQVYEDLGGGEDLGTIDFDAIEEDKGRRAVDPNLLMKALKVVHAARAQTAEVDE